MKWFLRGSTLTLVLILSLIGCQNAFQVGLGEETDLETPRVSLKSPDTGSFLTGTVTLRGTADDDREVEAVDVSFDRGSTWTSVDSFDSSSGEWSYEFDSTTRPDGRLFVTARTTDSADRTTTTDDTVYNIDNSPPVVLVNEPRSYESLTFNTDAVITVNAADLHAIQKFGSVVELSLDGKETWEEIETSEVEQSTTWTKLFESREYTSEAQPEAHFRFYLWAEDEAGNRSSSFYHIDDLNADDGPWTADTLLDELEGRGSLNEEDIRAVRMPENGEFTLFFDENADVPTIDWISPVSAEPGGIPGTRSEGLLAGIFRDDDGIDLDSARIEIKRAPDFSLNDYEADPDGVTWDDSVWTEPELPSTAPELVSSDISSVSWEHRLGADLGQGYFRAQLSVNDIDGTVNDPYARVFVINDGSPSIEIDSPDTIYFNNNFVLEGRASAPADGELEGVSVDIHDGASSDTDWALDGGNASYNSETQSWTYNTDAVDLPGLNGGSDLSALADGNILVRAAAYIGDSSDARQITMVKDTVPPDVGIDSPSADSSLNKTAEIQGFSSDDLSGIDTVEVSVDGSGSDRVLTDWTAFSTTADLATDGYEFSGVSTNWTLRIDTARFDDATTLDVSVRAHDRAGNTTQTTRSYTVDQDTDLPTLTVSNMDVDGTKFDNVLSGDPRLIGSVSDDDAVSPDTFEYRVWRASDSTWSEWYTVYAAGEEDPTPRLDFNIPLLNPDNDSQFLGDGSHQLQLRITDIDGAGGILTSLEDGTGLTRAEPTESDPESPVPSEVVEFSVDKGAPTITIDSPSSSFITREDFDMTVRVSDGFGIDTVDISFNGGDDYEDPPLYSFAEVGGDPEKNLNYTDADTERDPILIQVGDGGDIADDGTYNIRMRAKDLSESEATENITVTVDTTTPTIEFTRPTGGETVNSDVLIQGRADDNIQVAGVYWYITPDNNPPADVETEWTEFDNRYSWEYTWDSYAYQQTEQGNFDQAPYYFHTIAVDTAGNWNDVQTLALTVDQESDRPTLDISNMDIAGSGLPDPAGTTPDNLFGEDALITGSVEDDDGVTGSGLTYRTRTWDWDADAGAGAYGAWSAAAGDAWTPIDDVFSGERTNGNWSQPADSLGDGVHEIEFRVEDIAYDDTVAEADNFNWQQIGPVEFAIDTARPEPAFTEGLSENTTSYLKGDTPFSGTAADANGIHEVTASYYPDDDPANETTIAITGEYVDGEYTWSGEFPQDTAALADKDYTVTITATDRLGRSGSITAPVYVDTEAPTLTISNLENGDLITTSDLSISGTSEDGAGSGVAGVEYSTDGGTTWLDAAGASRWSVTLEGLEESLDNTIRLRATDEAGNVSASVERSFQVDLAAPTIEDFAFTGVNSSGSSNYASADFGFDFTAADSQELESVEISRSGTTDPVVSNSYTSTSTSSESISYSEAVAGTDGLADGDYTYTITVEDIAGRTTTLQETVIVDTTAPDIEITNLTPTVDDGGDVRVNGTIRFNASAGDAGGLQGVKWWMVRTGGADPETPPTDYDSADGTPFGGSPYEAQQDTTVLTDETEYTLYIIARDRAGNDAETSQPVIVDQSSDVPVAEFTDLDAGINSEAELDTDLDPDTGDQNNLFELNARIRGVLEDDDGIDADTVEIALNPAVASAAELADGDFTPVSSVGSSGRSVSFTHSLEEVADDVHYFYLRFSDDSTAKLDDSPEVQTATVGPIYFAIDTQNPSISFTAPAANSFQSDAFTVSGTAGDASGIANLELSTDGTTYTAVTDDSADGDPAFTEWSDSVDISGITDGTVTLYARAADRFEKTSEIERQVTVDRGAPTVTLDEPLGGRTVNSTVRLRGSTTDEFTVDKTYWWIGAENDTAPDPDTNPGDWTAFANRYSWDYDWDTFGFQQDVQGNLDAANYSIHVVAQDSAGNWSDIDTVTVTIDQESNKPVIEMTSIDSGAAADSNLLPTNLRINGTVEDDDAVDRQGIQVRVDTLSDGSEALPWTDITGAPDSDGAFVSWAHTFRDEATNDPTLVDGQYQLYVRAADINDEGYVDGDYTWSQKGPVEFAVDAANPSGTVTAPDQGAYVNEDTFNITGTASDANGVASVELSFDGADPVPADDTSGGDPAFSSWEYTFDSAEFTEGQISYEVIVTDTYDKVTTISRNFVLDQTAPTVAYIQPDDAATVNGSLLVRGTSDDAYAVETVSYAVAPAADAQPSYPDDYTDLSGTFSWDFRINTTDYDDGDYTIYVVAADAAGNANDTAPATRDVSFDQSTDLPVVEISNASGDDQNPTLFGSGGSILGTVTDDDGVDPDSIEITFTENPAEGDWIPVSNPPSSGGVSVSFSHSLDDVDEQAGTYTVQVRAADVGETHTEHTIAPVTDESAQRYIGVDRNNPAVDLNNLDIVDPYGGDDRTESYSAGMLVNNDFTLNGTASDASGVTEVRVQIDENAVDTATYNSPDWSYVVPVPRAPDSDGPMTIDVEAEDEWGKITTRTYNIVIDTSEPTVTFTEPDFGSTVNGTVTLRGTNSDANSITDLFLELGRYDTDYTPVELTNTGTRLSWEAEVDSNDYANDTTDGGAGTETAADSNVWDVPFVVTVLDAAGNRAEEEQILQVDPDSDKPGLAITGPNDGASVPSEFVFQGTITDDDPAPMSVDLAVDSNNDGTFDVELGSITDITSGSWVEIIDTTDTALFDPAPSGTIQLRAIPYDQYGTAGNAAVHEVFVDTAAPVVSIDSPADNSIVSGDITVTGTFRDDQQLAESQMRISFDGGNSFDEITSITDATISGATEVDGEYVYDFTVPVDTTTEVAGGNGFLETAVRVTDATFKQGTSYLDLSVDNTRPEMELNYDGSMEFFGSGEDIVYTFDGNEAEGGNFIVIGSSEDTGTVSGIERVDVYFVKDQGSGDEFLGVRDGVDPLAVTTDSLYDQDGIEQTGVPYRVPSARTSPDDGVLEDDYVISIDNRFERGIYDSDTEFGDQDDFQESLRTVGAIDEWYTYIDTTVLPDGPFTLYAVVYDLAGNKSFIEASAQAANYPPRISGVQVGAQDLGESESEAKVQGTVNFVLDAEDTVDPFTNEGIDVDTFKLTVAGQYAVGTGGAIGAEQTGFTPFFYGSQTGATADFDSRTPATGSDVSASAEISIDTVATFDSGYWYRFVAEAIDLDGNTTSREFYVWINNNDNLAPVVTIDDFEQGSVSGVPGHLDLPDAANAAASGTVNLTGTIYDDTSVDSLFLEISPDGGTSWEPLGTVNTFGDPVSGDVVSGYTYDWTYEWDTASIASIPGIAGAAQEDLIIRAYGNDGTNDTAVADRPELGVDVVPYITDLQTGFDSGLLRYGKRSALGQYPVAVGSEITILGYNLSGEAADSVSVGGTLLTPSAGSGADSVVVDLGIADTSGDVEVITNGVSSRNNTNDNALPHNQESNLFNDSLTDDRSIAFWDLTSHSDLSNKRDAAMRLNAAGDGVNWLYAEGGNYLRYTDGALNGNSYMTDGFAIDGGDFAYNDDGTLFWLYLHDSTWTTLTEWGWFGSVQWGRDVTGTRVEDVTTAYNWHLPDYAYLGLGNMSFEGDTNVPYSNVTQQDSQLGRYEDLRMVVSGTDVATDNHVAYRDVSSSARAVVYYGFEAGTGVTATTALDGAWGANISKTVDFTNKAYAPEGNDGGKRTGILTPTDRRGVITTDNATFFDLGVTSDGTAVAAWYDADAGNLKLAYNPTPMTDATNWTERTNPVALDAGAHVALEIDPNDGIHLAYLDAGTGYMNYSYLPAHDAPDADIQTVLVDGLLSSGQFNGMTVRDFGAGDYRPVISTFSTSYSGTRGSVRAAWPATDLAGLADGADADGVYTGNWEVMFVPASVVPAADSTFIESADIDSNGTTEFVIGYNGTNLEEATYLGWD